MPQPQAQAAAQPPPQPQAMATMEQQAVVPGAGTALAVSGVATAQDLTDSGRTVAASAEFTATTQFGGRLLMALPPVSPLGSPLTSPDETDCDAPINRADDDSPATTSKAAFPQKRHTADSSIATKVEPPDSALAESGGAPPTPPSEHTDLAPEGEDREAQAGPHLKFNVVLLNFGAPRVKGKDAYAANLLGLPCWIGMICEATASDAEDIEHATVPWSEADQQPRMEHNLVAEPPQGFAQCGPDGAALAAAVPQVRRWIVSERHDDLLIVARATHAASVERLASWSDRVFAGTARSRLLTALVRWRHPVDGRDSVMVTVGHIHNDTAKTKGVARTRFFDELAECCAGGTRLVGLDANMALFAVVPELFDRGVDATLIAHHQEFGIDGKLLHDSMGI